MDTTMPTAEWTVAHRDTYGKFLNGVLRDIDRYTSAKECVGKYVLADLRAQAAKLEDAQLERGPAFDTRVEANEFIMSLYHNLKHLAKRAEAYNPTLDEPLGQLRSLQADTERLSWVNSYGVALVRYASNMGGITKECATMLPLRSGALGAVVVTGMLALKTPPSLDLLNFVLESVWRGFWNYHMDYRKVVQWYGPRFLEAMKPVNSIVELVDKGMAKEAAIAEAKRIAEEAAARQAEEEEEEEARRVLWATEAQPHNHQQQYASDADDDSYAHLNTSTSSYTYEEPDYWSNHNPANGMPTTSPYGFDVMGNSYGFND